MSEMVDRAVKALEGAIYVQACDNRCTCRTSAERFECGTDKTFSDVVRIVIEALREPTEAMAEACRTSTDDHVGGLVAWGIMIDAALGKEGS